MTTATKLFEKLKNIKTTNATCAYTEERCARLSPIIEKIQDLKSEKKALILAHSYVHPDIVYGVADHVGDSYFLSKKALETDAEIIVFAAVRFMAETAKLLAPSKCVIDPNPNGGCTLADSCTADDVRALKARYSDHTFVCYINTTAAVKAECDVCVTSSVVNEVIEKIENDKIVFLPDKYMGENICQHLKERGIEKRVVLFDGRCYVHEEFTAEEVDVIKMTRPDVQVLAHPECQKSVANKADMIGSTGKIIEHVRQHHNDKTPFLILTECGIASRMQVEYPDIEIVGSCMLCRYMKSNTLQNIAAALENPSQEQIIKIDPQIASRAKRCIDNMFAYV